MGRVGCRAGWVAGRPCRYVESWLTTLPPFMVGVPELFLERPCFSPISCREGSLYMHTARKEGERRYAAGSPPHPTQDRGCEVGPGGGCKGERAFHGRNCCKRAIKRFEDKHMFAPNTPLQNVLARGAAPGRRSAEGMSCLMLLSAFIPLAGCAGLPAHIPFQVTPPPGTAGQAGLWPLTDKAP